ncbi:MAG: hypothetical protein JF606_02305 [Burkholderiales bacterium]|jgi:hypothetical protein|nr:hypothetical protein [Burkholderiales bacterium]
MKHAKTALAALIATAFMGTAAFAETNASTAPGATTVKPEVTAPATAPTGADVKADAKATAANQGAKKQPKAADVKDDTKADAKAATPSGDTAKGDAELKVKR